jgi:hypothetical protein
MSAAFTVVVNGCGAVYVERSAKLMWHRSSVNFDKYSFNTYRQQSEGLQSSAMTDLQTWRQIARIFKRNSNLAFESYYTERQWSGEEFIDRFSPGKLWRLIDDSISAKCGDNEFLCLEPDESYLDELAADVQQMENRQSKGLKANKRWENFKDLCGTAVAWLFYGFVLTRLMIFLVSKFCQFLKNLKLKTRAMLGAIQLRPDQVNRFNYKIDNC